MSSDLVPDVTSRQERSQSPWSLSVGAWPLVCGVVFISMGVLLEYSPPEINVFGLHFGEIPLVSLIFKELGVAFLIAYIIAILIEKKAREAQDRLFREQLHRVQKNVIEAVYAKKIPDDFLKYIETHLFEQKFYRKNLDVNYVIRSREDSTAEINLTTAYEVTNNSYSTSSYEVRLSFEKPFRIDLPDHVKLKRLYVKAEASPKPLVDLDEKGIEEAIRKNTIKRSDTSALINYSYAFDINPGAIFSVRIENTWLAKTDGYDFWRGAAPSDGICYAVYRTDENLNVHVVAIHPEDPVKVFGGPGEAKQAWEIKSPLAPHQGFLVWWSPKIPVNAAMAPAEPP
jgi:hypothetical protein